MTERYQVAGLQALRDSMLALPKKLQGRALKNALFSGGKVIRDEAKLRAPRSTGKLAENIIVALANRAETVELDEGVVVTVRASGKRGDPKNAFYWRFLEFGHAVRVPRSLERSVRRLRRRSKAFLGSAAVRLVPAQPFMRPAFEAKKYEALGRIRDSLAAELEKLYVRVGLGSR